MALWRRGYRDVERRTLAAEIEARDELQRAARESVADYARKLYPHAAPPGVVLEGFLVPRLVALAPGDDGRIPRRLNREAPPAVYVPARPRAEEAIGGVRELRRPGSDHVCFVVDPPEPKGARRRG